MRILQVNEKYGQFGGVERFINRLTVNLRQRGLSVGLAFQERMKKADDEFVTDGLFEIPGLSDFTYDKISEIENRIEDCVKTFQPDIVHLHSIRNPFAIKKFISLKPTVWFCHDYYFTCLRQPPDRFSKFFGQAENFNPDFFCYLLALLDGQLSLNPVEAYRRIKNKQFEQQSFLGIKKITVDSEYVKKTLINCSFFGDLIEILPSTIESLPPLPSPIPNQGNVLFVGRLEREKGILVFLESLLLLKTADFKVKIAGAGRCEEQVKTFIRTHSFSGQVEFLGYQKSDSLPALYSWADLVAVPSIWPEPFGMTGIEAMSYARPVVGFNVGGTSEWLKDNENGLFAKYNDPKDLVLKIDWLLANKDKSERFGLNGRRMVEERFTIDKYSERLLEIYQEISQ